MQCWATGDSSILMLYTPHHVPVGYAPTLVHQRSAHGWDRGNPEDSEGIPRVSEQSFPEYYGIGVKLAELPIEIEFTVAGNLLNLYIMVYETLW